ncbi:O-Antigen ligase [Saccharicrinis carchari]|uniref:O-Antigen ligase n=1 Tax=Saccharicrinis carchari TaxID=1168039 RepID=A0A521EPA7_SACCC|nr:O-antigen ligase family protein [Saccharicrinis carchari]SMO85748.1 O-Antigen ligase [Saccharicrinis carchari]
MLNLSKITNYLLVYLLIAFSGVPFFYRAHIAMMIVFLLFPAVVFVIRKQRVDRFFIYYLVVVLIIQMGQMLKFYDLPAKTFLGLHARLLFAYLTIKAVGKKTPQYYINILIFSVYTSLFFYLLSYNGALERFMENTVAPLFTNPLIEDDGYKKWPDIILYTFNPQGEGLLWLKRNSGPFWEPGAFSGFLMIALLFNIIITGRLNNKKNRILMLGVVSTFSTSGLLVMGCVIVFYLMLNRDRGTKYILLPVVFLLGVVAFVSFDFMGNKIISKMSYTDQTYNTRFKSAMIDLKDFSKHPFFGMGRSQNTRYEDQTDARAMHRNNGVSNQLVMYGGLAFVLYFYLVYLSFYRLCIAHGVNKKMALFALLTIWLIGFSQIYFTKVLFLSLTMLSTLYPKRSAKSVRCNEINEENPPGQLNIHRADIIEL